MAGGILGLDLSGRTGWSYGERGLRPIWGVWHLPTFGGEGGRFAAFENELAAAIEEHQPRTLVVEAPLSLHALTRADVVNQQRGLRAFVYSEGYRSEVQVVELDAAIIREELLGYRRAPKGQDIKQLVLRHFHDWGWPVVDDNAADAVMLVEFYASALGWRLATGPKV